MRINCNYCGVEFERPKSHLARRNYCGMVCRNADFRTYRRGENNSNWRGTVKVVICAGCRSEFRPKNCRAQFCSAVCYRSTPLVKERLRAQAKRAGLLGGTMSGGKDANHDHIVALLIADGFKVLDLHRLGRGLPDLLVEAFDVPELVEIKNPATKYGRAGFTPAQLRFASEWRGGQPIILRNEADIAALREHCKRKAAAICGGRSPSYTAI